MNKETIAKREKWDIRIGIGSGLCGNYEKKTSQMALKKKIPQSP